jgi:hypothetical protein
MGIHDKWVPIPLISRVSSFDPRTTAQITSSWQANSNDRKEMKSMKYETPELTALPPAISAIRVRGPKGPPDTEEHFTQLPINCYEDNE